MKSSILLLLIFCLVFPELVEEDSSTQRGLASSWMTVVPSRSLAGLHYIFKGFTIDEEEEQVKVTGPIIELTNVERDEATVFQDGFSSVLDLDDFEDEQERGQSVFEASTRTGTRVGTAFLVGRSTVLTNRHVMNISDKEAKARKWGCGKFDIRLNHKEERISCKEVRFCGTQLDFCVVELNPMSNGLEVGAEVRILRLTNKVRLDREETLTHIGNAAGLGLQASKGQGVALVPTKPGEFKHFVPTLGGSSGAPIFDDRGEVLGMNYGRNGKTYIADGAYNVGVLSTAIYNALLMGSPDTIKQIKSFRKWYRKSKKPVELQVRAKKN